jgi:hypothetical protein
MKTYRQYALLITTCFGRLGHLQVIQKKYIKAWEIQHYGALMTEYLL